MRILENPLGGQSTLKQSRQTNQEEEQLSGIQNLFRINGKMQRKKLRVSGIVEGQYFRSTLDSYFLILVKCFLPHKMQIFINLVNCWLDGIIMLLMTFSYTFLLNRLYRASSTNGLPPLSPPPSLEPYRIRSNSSASSCDDSSLSTFRSQSFSNSSTTSLASPIYFPELTIPNFSQLIGNVNPETDLDDIRLDDLNIGSGPDIPDPAEIIREYLHPSDQETTIFVNQNLTVSFVFKINCDK
jgi:hypothetical protein